MKKEKYSYGLEGGLWMKKHSASSVAKELKRIEKKYGSIKPEYLVKESEAEDSLLHDCFEWDNKKAANKYRLGVAGDIIRSIRVEIIHQDQAVKIRAFVNVRQEEKAKRSYIPVFDAVLNEVAYNDLLNQAKKEMSSFVTIYSQIVELNNVKAEMLKVLAQ